MNRFRWSGIAAVAAIIFQLAAPALAVAAGPFDGLQGSWAGSGTIAMNDGTRQRMQCRVQYTIAADGSNLQQALRCKSDSQEFHVNAYVAANGSALSGNWTETSRNVTGSVSGHVSGNRIAIKVAAGGDAFSATMVLVTTGNKQAVTIEPKGTDVSRIAVTLARG